MVHFWVTRGSKIFLHTLGVTIPSWEGSTCAVFLRLFTAEFTNVPQPVPALPPGFPQEYPHPEEAIRSKGLT